MSIQLPNQLEQTLKDKKQEHLLQFWHELGSQQQEKLLSQLQKINWQNLDNLIKKHILTKQAKNEYPSPIPAPYKPLTPKTPQQQQYYQQAIQKATQLLTQGKIAAFTVAGGQGTRLGYDAPKGCYPITPVKKKSLFQIFAETLYRAQQRYNTTIPWYIMTSPINDSQTRAFFSQNNYFGLNSSNIFFFPQGTMPAIDNNGKLLLQQKDSLALSPNGHGGSLLAIKESGALADMTKRGIQHISYFQVDNALVHPIDPLFIGLHALEQAEMSCRSLTKTEPFERLGNFCICDNKLTIIEYSDMPEELATATDQNNQLKFRAGSPAIHLITTKFIHKLTQNGIQLPVHKASKKVPYIDQNGNPKTPTTPNATKLEMFIFDALPMASKTLILEMNREEQFAPVKNPTGIDSVESCRQLISNRAKNWLTKANIPLPTNPDQTTKSPLEISTKSFMDYTDLQETLTKRTIKNTIEGYYE